MIKHFFSVFIFIFIFLFIFFVFSTYVSENNQKKIDINRTNVHLKIDEMMSTLPLLKNDTSDIIEFNSGYNKDTTKIKRSFWNLFKKDD